MEEVNAFYLRPLLDNGATASQHREGLHWLRQAASGRSNLALDIGQQTGMNGELRFDGGLIISICCGIGNALQYGNLSRASCQFCPGFTAGAPEAEFKPSLGDHGETGR